MSTAFTRNIALVAVLATSVLVSGVVQASPATFADANQMAINEKKLLLVDFYAEW